MRVDSLKLMAPLFTAFDKVHYERLIPRHLVNNARQNSLTGNTHGTRYGPRRIIVYAARVFSVYSNTHCEVPFVADPGLAF